MRPLILLLALSAPLRAQELQIVQPAPPPKKLFVYTSAAFNVWTYLGPKGTAKAVNTTPADRAIVGEQVGFGYFVHPLVRLTLTLQFAEYATNPPAGASSFALFGVIPWVTFVYKGFFTGGGLLLAPVSYGKAPNFDVGVFTATGYSIGIGRGVSLAPAVQFVVMWNQRVAVQLTPTLALGYRF